MLDKKLSERLSMIGAAVMMFLLCLSCALGKGCLPRLQ